MKWSWMFRLHVTFQMQSLQSYLFNYSQRNRNAFYIVVVHKTQSPTPNLSTQCSAHSPTVQFSAHRIWSRRAGFTDKTVTRPCRMGQAVGGKLLRPVLNHMEVPTCSRIFPAPYVPWTAPLRHKRQQALNCIHFVMLQCLNIIHVWYFPLQYIESITYISNKTNTFSTGKFL